MFRWILKHFEVLLSCLFDLAGEHGTTTWEEMKTRKHEVSWIMPPLYDPFINRIQTQTFELIICVEKRPHVFILKRTKERNSKLIPVKAKWKRCT